MDYNDLCRAISLHIETIGRLAVPKSVTGTKIITSRTCAGGGYALGLVGKKSGLQTEPIDGDGWVAAVDGVCQCAAAIFAK